MTGPSRRTALFGAAGALALCAGDAPAFRLLARANGLTARTRAGVAFGTTVALTFAGPDAAALDAAIVGGFAAIRACERAASLTRPDSALSRLNRDGALENPDPHLLALTRFALELAQASEGAFDPTVQPLWPLWRDATDAGRRPTPDELRRAVDLIDWRGVEASEARIAFARPGMAMTLNSVLQGYAADRVIAQARACGAPNAFVDTGEFGAYGVSADGTPWRLGVAETADAAAPAFVDEDFVGFAATSAGSGTAFSADGADNHLFDPRTGLSPSLVSRTTVFAPSGLTADGLSTAAYVMGPDRGRALAEARGCSLLAKLSNV
ncbi:FAD:protein FMN transferase [Methylopila sp. M107]|uniref:FAD:protein FMN transferase n=1 Tax=Methylopila sp. M107 TaxID=1101190 RepID=UPI000377BA6D|nr:FAD:protein FMN transferase [Methylopila sp. M107]